MRLHRPLRQTLGGWICIVLVLIATGFWAMPGYGQTGAKITDEALAEVKKTTESTIQDDVKALQQRIEQLEMSKAFAEREAEDPRRWNIRLGGHIQMDYVMWAQADPSILGAENYFSYRRLRLLAEGTGYEQYDFRLQVTLEPGNLHMPNTLASPDVKDVYCSINDIPGLGRFRVGNFFVPFSLEQVTNDTNNIFLERSIPTQRIFAVDREVGMALYNCTDDERVTWTCGVFFDNLSDTIKARFDANQGLRLVARLTWLPYYDREANGRRLVHTGIGILHTFDQDNHLLLRARPQVQRGPFLMASAPLSADTYTTGNLELAIVRNRLTWQSEAFISQINLLDGQTRHVGGAYAHVSCFLTGEHRNFEPFGQHGAQFALNTPNRDFKLTRGVRQWGAWEAKARWSYLNLEQVAGGQYNDLSVGLNWYWSDRVRWMFDWIHPMTTAESLFGSTRSDLLGLRFDINW